MSTIHLCTILSIYGAFSINLSLGSYTLKALYFPCTYVPLFNFSYKYFIYSSSFNEKSITSLLSFLLSLNFHMIISHHIYFLSILPFSNSSAFLITTIRFFRVFCIYPSIKILLSISNFR